MNLHDLLKLKCKIYYDGQTFIGSHSSIVSDTFREIRQYYPIEYFNDLDKKTEILLRSYYRKFENLTDLKDYIEEILGKPLTSKNRKSDLVFARQVFFAKARYAGYPYEMMADFLKRDHSTAIHNVKKFCYLSRDRFVREYYLKYMTNEEIDDICKFLNQ